jgi:hypothetical protein
MIPRATVPDSTTLGFDIDFALVDAAKIAGEYMPKLNEAFSSSDAEGLWSLMYEDGWIKDLYMVGFLANPLLWGSFPSAHQ